MRYATQHHAEKSCYTVYGRSVHPILTRCTFAQSLHSYLSPDVYVGPSKLASLSVKASSIWTNDLDAHDTRNLQTTSTPALSQDIS